ncbi:MAG: molybdopterin-dependent oxidoreductase [Nitrospinales bacterium]
MTTATQKIVTFKIDNREVKAREGIPILEAAKQNGFEITNLCYNQKLKPFAACRTCMVEMRSNGDKELVYSCTQPVAEGIEVTIHTEETDRYNNACLEMLLVEHPLDCPTCDKSGVCPLQDNTEAMGIYNGRFEIKRRNEPSIKTNPIIEFYLNRCIMCGLCVRACDETQGVNALDFHKRGMSVGIGTANDEPLDCEFCGQCITVCPTGALMDLTSEARGLAALFTSTETTCNFCSWGCTINLETKKGRLIRIETDDNAGAVGINDGNLCAKGRFGHGFVNSGDRLTTPLINIGGTFQEIGWGEAIKTIAERLRATVNRNGPQSIAGIGGEKLTNEESYLFQKLFRGIFGSNQVTNLQNLRSPAVNRFMLNCFANGIAGKPVTELEKADVVLIFNSDLPSEFPVAGNAVRKGAVFTGTDLIIANPRKVVFQNEANVEIRLPFTLGSDLAALNRLCRIIIDRHLVDLEKVKAALPNYDAFVQSLASCTADAAEKITGLADDVLTHAAERFARKADRFILCGNDILENEQSGEILNALLNLCLLAHCGGEGSVSVFPPREHCNSQGVNDMGVTPEFLPGYRPAQDAAARADCAAEWQCDLPAFDDNNPAQNLFENCRNGEIKALYIAGEDPVHSYYKGGLTRDALRTVPFLVVQDVVMTDTAQLADIVLPTASYAEKEGSFTNMTRHVQRVAPAILPPGSARTDFDILVDLAAALDKPFAADSPAEVQEEIGRLVPFYKGLMDGYSSRQWLPDGFAEHRQFAICGETKTPDSSEEYPFKLLTNNHMFHIGSYTQYARALTEIGPDCIAQINRADAKSLGIQSGDKVVIASEKHRLELPVEVNGITARGMVYIPKNWVQHPVNLFRNGEEGFVSVRVAKAE